MLLGAHVIADQQSDGVLHVDSHLIKKASDPLIIKHTFGVGVGLEELLDPICVQLGGLLLLVFVALA